MIKKALKKYDIVKKLIYTAVYLAIVFALFLLNVQCIFKTYLHIPCPGCGMTRAMLSAVRLDFVSAFRYHMMFWSMPLLYIYFLLDGHLFKNRKIDKAILFTILAGFVINWVIALVRGI